MTEPSSDSNPPGQLTEHHPDVSREHREPLVARATISGLCLGSLGLPPGLVQGMTGDFVTAPASQRWGAWGVVCLWLYGALAVTRARRLGRLAITLGLLGFLCVGLPLWLRSPLSTLAVLVASTSVLFLLFDVGSSRNGRISASGRPQLDGRALGACAAALLLWLFFAFADTDRSSVDTPVVGWAMCVALGLCVGFGLTHLRAEPVRAGLLLASFALVAAVSLTLFWRDFWWMTNLFVVPTLSAAVIIRTAHRPELERARWWGPLVENPERLFVGTFLVLCILGTILLALPQSSSSGQSFGLVDAAFTATSAVCVTGLIVLDTPVALSGFGQSVVLILIQVGGLGIMTFSTVALWVLGRRMSLRHEGAVASLLGPEDRGDLVAAAKRILVFTVTTELLGATILTAAFLAQGRTLGQAVWQGVFTAVSAFCNAGFALFSDSLVSYQRSPVVLHTMGILILLGALSPACVFALPRLFGRFRAPISAQIRLALSATAVLLVAGFVLILAIEWNRTLAGLSPLDRLQNAWFQSITLRSAGFNSLDLNGVHPATFTLMLVFMFIGGNPGGTAAGVKTTTIAVLVLSALQAMRGIWTLEIFGRTIPERTRAKAAAIVVIAVASGIVALSAVLLTQKMPTRLAVFEVVSALGTVGLSLGGTNLLDGVGKAVIIVCMFVGRVGGLTMLMFLNSRRVPPTLGRPVEEMDVG